MFCFFVTYYLAHINIKKVYWINEIKIKEGLIASFCCRLPLDKLQSKTVTQIQASESAQNAKRPSPIKISRVGQGGFLRDQIPDLHRDGTICSVARYQRTERRADRKKNQVQRGS